MRTPIIAHTKEESMQVTESEFTPSYDLPPDLGSLHKNCINEFDVQNVTQNTFSYSVVDFLSLLERRQP